MLFVVEINHTDAHIKQIWKEKRYVLKSGLIGNKLKSTTTYFGRRMEVSSLAVDVKLYTRRQALESLGFAYEYEPFRIQTYNNNDCDKE